MQLSAVGGGGRRRHGAAQGQIWAGRTARPSWFKPRDEGRRICAATGASLDPRARLLPRPSADLAVHGRCGELARPLSRPPDQRRVRRQPGRGNPGARRRRQGSGSRRTPHSPRRRCFRVDEPRSTAIDDVRARAATTRQPAGAAADRLPAAEAAPGLVGPVAENLAEQGRRRCRCADHHRHHQRSPARCTQRPFQAEYTRPLSVPIEERSHGPGTSR